MSTVPSRILTDRTSWPEYQYLFAKTTVERLSPIDGVDLLTSVPLSPQFVQLAQSSFRSTNNPYEDKYLYYYSFDHVTVWVKPMFPNTPKVKIRINPSAAGYSLSQVYAWIDFIIGPGHHDKVRIKRCEFKCDMHGVSIADCTAKLWCPGRYRKTWNEKDTVYHGIRQSAQQQRLYDKGQELQDTGSMYDVQEEWSRIEVITHFKRYARQPTMDKFVEFITNEGPFANHMYIDVPTEILNLHLSRYGIVHSEQQGINETFKLLKPHQRNLVIKRLTNGGYIRMLHRDYQAHLDEWLSC